MGKPPLKYINTDHVAARGNIQVLGGKTGYNDVARYCLVIATKVDGRTYYMSFLSNEGKLTRFGDVARVADWLVAHRPKGPAAGAPAVATGPEGGPPPPLGVVAPPPEEAPVATAPPPQATAPAPAP